jgi:hypothetical protein
VQASPEAVQLIQEQGGKLYVGAKRSRCCHGSLTFLETSNEPAERSYRRVSADEIELYLDERLGDPEELVIEAGARAENDRQRDTTSAAPERRREPRPSDVCQRTPALRLNKSRT